MDPLQNGQAVPLWAAGAPGLDTADPAFVPTLTPYLLPGATGCVIVCPGGGYASRAPHESGPVAEAFNARGFSAFVLDYRVAPYRFPYPLLDAQRAVRTVRARAGELALPPDRIAVLGFSAGGHLAATAGTHFDAGNDAADDPIERASSRPDALILCYPVISFGPHGHEGACLNLLGDEPAPEAIEDLCNELQVTPETPPSFLWHTADDPGVPVMNSLLFAEACAAEGVPFELHVYNSGAHGLGLAEESPHVATWIDLAAEWLREQLQ